MNQINLGKISEMSKKCLNILKGGEIHITESAGRFFDMIFMAAEANFMAELIVLEEGMEVHTADYVPTPIIAKPFKSRTQPIMMVWEEE
jgi:hypothetical protein